MATLDSIYFEIDTAVGGWMWRIRGRNHEKMAVSEILTRRETAVHAIREVKLTGSTAPVWDRPNQTWITV